MGNFVRPTWVVILFFNVEETWRNTWRSSSVDAGGLPVDRGILFYGGQRSRGFCSQCPDPLTSVSTSDPEPMPTADKALEPTRD